MGVYACCHTFECTQSFPALLLIFGTLCTFLSVNALDLVQPSYLAEVTAHIESVKDISACKECSPICYQIMFNSKQFIW